MLLLLFRPFFSLPCGPNRPTTKRLCELLDSSSIMLSLWHKRALCPKQSFDSLSSFSIPWCRDKTFTDWGIGYHRGGQSCKTFLEQRNAIENHIKRKLCAKNASIKHQPINPFWIFFSCSDWNCCVFKKRNSFGLELSVRSVGWIPVVLVLHSCQQIILISQILLFFLRRCFYLLAIRFVSTVEHNRVSSSVVVVQFQFHFFFLSFFLSFFRSHMAPMRKRERKKERVVTVAGSEVINSLVT